MSSEQSRDPRKAEPRPPFPQQRQRAPGSEAELQPRADHGERTYQGHGRLAGKAALITGGDSGIGRAVALAFAREGADVMIAYLDEHEDAQTTVSLVEEAGRKAEAVAGDVQDETHCRALVARALESIQAYDPSESLPPYAATKGAIINFTKSVAKQAMKRGIRVNAVAPGATWTPLIPQTGFADEKVQQFGKDSVLGRPAQPVEPAPVYVLLASDEASYITGEVYGVTGGRTPV